MNIMSLSSAFMVSIFSHLSLPDLRTYAAQLAPQGNLARGLPNCEKKDLFP